ncbi:MAG: hypothetical protein HUK00_00430 [Bacteroidaceae bacterium]|nr:hypothetical protein [Bacteroidaceae bacterium]
MTSEDAKVLQQTEFNIRQMMRLIDKLRTENKNLKSALEESEVEIELLKEEVEMQKQDYNTLQMARVIDVSDSDKAMTRNRLNALIREVDKCINIIKN